MSLPEPRDPEGPYRICLVCLGNICRSPIAEQVLRLNVERAGLAANVVIDSAGTGGWHVGAGMDRRAAATLRARGYPTEHTARRFDRAWFTGRDLILAMDAENLAQLRSAAPDEETAQDRIRLFRSFAPGAEATPEVPDPYYGGEEGFTTVMELVEEAGKEITAQLAAYYDGR